MNDRAKQVILGLLFWLAFGVPTFFIVLLLPVAMLIFALGNDHIRQRIYEIGKALDQLCNAALFGGLAKETISSHTGRYIKSGEPLPFRFRFVAWLTNLFETDHCVKAIEYPFVGKPL